MTWTNTLDLKKKDNLHEDQWHCRHIYQITFESPIWFWWDLKAIWKKPNKIRCLLNTDIDNVSNLWGMKKSDNKIWEIKQNFQAKVNNEHDHVLGHFFLKRLLFKWLKQTLQFRLVCIFFWLFHSIEISSRRKKISTMLESIVFKTIVNTFPIILYIVSKVFDFNWSFPHLIIENYMISYTNVI